MQKDIVWETMPQWPKTINLELKHGHVLTMLDVEQKLLDICVSIGLADYECGIDLPEELWFHAQDGTPMAQVSAPGTFKVYAEEEDMGYTLRNPLVVHVTHATHEMLHHA